MSTKARDHPHTSTLQYQHLLLLTLFIHCPFCTDSTRLTFLTCPSHSHDWRSTLDASRLRESLAPLQHHRDIVKRKRASPSTFSPTIEPILTRRNGQRHKLTVRPARTSQTPLPQSPMKCPRWAQTMRRQNCSRPWTQTSLRRTRFLKIQIA